MFRRDLIFLFTMIVNIDWCSAINPGPQVIATKGEIWPGPSFKTTKKATYIVNVPTLKFIVKSDSKCDLLNQAIQRYQFIVQKQFSSKYLSKDVTDLDEETYYYDTLNSIDIYMTKCEHLPYLNMDESYSLVVSKNSSIVGDSIWGVLRGLESFSQLLHFSSNYKEVHIKETKIKDRPRYSHRGLLVDTSRHFIPVKRLRKILDGMVYNKLNVFHWHIVDDQSFPYDSITYPKMSKFGAYSKKAIYSQNDIKGIIEYARVRGIRVIPEFDIPGHTRSWGVAFPWLLTECGDDENNLGPINPVRNTTYDFIKNFFNEIDIVFLDEYLHIGGDEIDFSCWERNSEVSQFMRNNKYTLDEVKNYFMKTVLNILSKRSKKIVWEEIASDDIEIPKDTLVQIWKGPNDYIMGKGFNVIYSACWYLDHLDSGGDWVKYHTCDPADYVKDSQIHQIVGGEACMWSEAVDASNIISRIFPRVSAAAERLWSDNNNSIVNATARMEEHACRMLGRGIRAQPPNGPGYCIYNV